MEIQYLTELEAKPKRNAQTSPVEGYSESEIIQLEQSFNNGNTFPRAYREYLFLAGKFSWILEQGEELPELMSSFNFYLEPTGIVMTRPFVPFGVTGPGHEGFYICYLDEGDDPSVHIVYMADPFEREARDLPEMELVHQSFSYFVNSCVSWQSSPENKFHNP
ncbi:MAG: SMI1/KNR4 family protein [Flavobacteriaceae bacterium]|nr:SMI1/KNR4 family protein [Flavobacteriaceae bacterium]